MQPQRTTTSVRGFVAGTLALVMVFAASGAPIPLYETYRVEVGLHPADLALSTVAYFVMVLASLLMLGRLSDHLGRRIVGIGAIAVAIAGSLVLLGVDGVGVLALGRGLQGLACGAAVTALTSYIVDCAPAQPHWLAANAAASASLLGLTVGPLAAGAFVQYAPLPHESVYVVTAVLLAGCAFLMALNPESTPKRSGAWRSLRPRVSCSPSAKRLLPAAAAVYLATWSLGGFFQAFSPSVVAQTLRTDNTLVLASMFAIFMAPSVIGGPLTNRLSSVNAQRLGIVVFGVAIVGMVMALRAGNFAVVLTASALAGVGQGAAMTGTMRGLMAVTSARQRAGTVALIYLISYSAAAAPSLVSSQLSKIVDLNTIAACYAVLAAASSVAAVALSRRKRG